MLSLFEYGRDMYPKRIGVNTGHGVPLFLRNVVAPAALRRTFLLLPQNAWPWTPWHGRGTVALRWAGLRVASWASMGRAAGVIRLSTAIPQPRRTKQVPILPNVLDPGFEAALNSPSRTHGLVDLADGSLMSIGSITPYRNTERLLDGHAAYVREGGRRQLVIVGPTVDDGLRRRIETRANKAVGHVHLVATPQPRSGILAAIRRCAGVVLPSLVEASPLTLLEAMACGVPVAASHIPGHLETAGSSGRDVVWFEPLATDEITESLHMLDLQRDITWPHGDRSWREQERKRWANELVSRLEQLMAK